MSFNFSKLGFIYLRFSYGPIMAISIAILSILSTEHGAILALRYSLSVVCSMVATLGMPLFFFKLRAQGDVSAILDPAWIKVGLFVSCIAFFSIILFIELFSKDTQYGFYYAFYSSVSAMLYLLGERYRSLEKWNKASRISLGWDSHSIIFMCIYSYISNDLLSIGDFYSFLCLPLLIPFIVVIMNEFKLSSPIRHIIILLRSHIYVIFIFSLGAITASIIGEFATVVSAIFDQKIIIAFGLSIKAGAIVTLPLMINTLIKSSEIAKFYKNSRDKSHLIIQKTEFNIFLASTLLLVLMFFASISYFKYLNLEIFISIPLLISAYINSLTGVSSIYLNMSGNEKFVLISQGLGALITILAAILSIIYNSPIILSIGLSLGIIIANLRMKLEVIKIIKNYEKDRCCI